MKGERYNESKEKHLQMVGGIWPLIWTGESFSDLGQGVFEGHGSVEQRCDSEAFSFIPPHGRIG